MSESGTSFWRKTSEKQMSGLLALVWIGRSVDWSGSLRLFEVHTIGYRGGSAGRVQECGEGVGCGEAMRD